MADIPLALNDLNSITEIVARDLLEQWAIDDRFTEDKIEEAKQDALDDTIYVINSFMNYFNEALLTAKTEKPSLII